VTLPLTTGESTLAYQILVSWQVRRSTLVATLRPQHCSRWSGCCVLSWGRIQWASSRSC